MSTHRKYSQRWVCCSGESHSEPGDMNVTKWQCFPTPNPMRLNCSHFVKQGALSAGKSTKITQGHTANVDVLSEPKGTKWQAQDEKAYAYGSEVCVLIPPCWQSTHKTHVATHHEQLLRAYTWAPSASIQILGPPLNCCVAFGKLPNISVS